MNSVVAGLIAVIVAGPVMQATDTEHTQYYQHNRTLRDMTIYECAHPQRGKVPMPASWCDAARAAR